MDDFVIKDGVLEKYQGSGGAVVIPDSVTSIGVRAFEGCSSLKYAPMMLIDRKVLYEPENRNGVKFIEIKQLVLEHDYFMKIPTCTRVIKFKGLSQIGLYI